MIWLYLFSRICGWSVQAVYLHAEYLLCCDGSIRTGILLQRLSEICSHCQFVHNFVLCLYDGEDFCRADQSFYISTSTLTLSIYLLWQEISRSVTTDSSYQCMQLQVHSLLWIINSFTVTLCCHHQWFCWLLIYKCSSSICGLLFEVPSRCLRSLLFCSFTVCELLIELPTQLYLYYLLVVVWAIYFVIPSLSVWCCLSSLLLSVGWCLSSLLSCSFTFCGLLFDVPTLLLWVVVWCTYSVVPSRTVGCCLMSILCCSFTNCGLLFELHTLLFPHYLWVVVWCPNSDVPSLSVGCCLSSLLHFFVVL